MRLITGIQPTGLPTIGNYLGSIKNFKSQLDKVDDAYIFLADLHTLTINPLPEEFFENVKSLVALYIAMGLDKEANIFLQSSVSEHSELAWILQCHSKLGELDRMTQFKDKSSKNISINTGLYTYPVLMAADILLYNADVVPVGEDQKQHLELTRDLAQRFNSFYKTDVIKEPNPVIAEHGAKIYSLVDPYKKMSKSDENPKSYITLLDTPKQIEKKIKSATTDSIGEINFDKENQPGVSNLLVIYSLCKDISIDEAVKYFKDKNYGFLKSEVANAIIGELEPIQKKYYDILENEDEIKSVLENGTRNAKSIAKENIKIIKKTMGFYE